MPKLTTDLEFRQELRQPNVSKCCPDGRADVTVFISANVALKKPTEQNPENGTYSRTSDRANDGAGSCSETAGIQDIEWWTVDLQDDYDIKYLTVSTRADAGGKIPFTISTFPVPFSASS
jgi:hypothetical protein